MLRLSYATIALLALSTACEAAPADERDAATAAIDAAPAVDASRPIDAARPPPFVGPTGTTEGCGQPFEGRGVIDRTLTIREVERRYRLVVPETYAPDAPHALVFAFHGLGDRAENFQAALRFEQTAEGAAILVYPHGVHPLFGANGWDTAADSADVELFDTVRTQLESEFCVDRAREFAIGFSYGAFFTNALGCLRGDVLRAIAPIAGGGPTGGGCVGQVAVMLVHGQADTRIPYGSFGMRSHSHWRRRNGCSETGPEDANGCIRYEGCDSGYPTVFCSHPGGHTVPSYARGAIWEFLESLPATAP